MMSPIATIIDIALCVIGVLALFEIVTLIFVMGFILYEEIRYIRSDRDE
jgi:hypothetical protein